MANQVKLSAPIRFRPDAWMTKALRARAAELSAASGKKLGLSAALRDAVSVALRGTAPGAAYSSGFREGFILGYSETKVELAAAARRGRGGRTPAQ